MDVFGVLTMLGGLALFLYGMNTMGDSLSKASSGRLEQVLEKLTSNRWKGVLFGAIVTAVLQSSSATTVMVVGFVNSGIMKLSQAISIIMGANVGTTITSWILSLSGIQGDALFLQLLKPANFSPALAVVGIGLILFSKKERRKEVGTILVGFAILMFGMETMSDAVKPLADVPEFTGILTMFQNPVLGVLAGAVLTAIIQSSSASVGILQALSVTGAISYRLAVPIIMGQNVGTCVTALLSSVGANKNAKRAAFVHLYFNILGTILFMAGFYFFNAIFHFPFLERPANGAGIAVAHTAFNLVATFVLLPFSKALESLSYMTIKEDKKEERQEEEDLRVLDIRFLDNPSYAMSLCKAAADKMASLSQEAVFVGVGLLEDYQEEEAGRILELEGRVDHYEDEIGKYLMKLGARDLTEEDSRTLSLILHSIGDFERISDHALNLFEAAKEKRDKKIKFSDMAEEELRIFSKAICEIVSLAVETFTKEDEEEAKRVEPLEDVVDKLNVKVKRRHVERFRQGVCTVEMGFLLSDITTNFERVADHCSNIALSILQKKEEFDSHEYLDMLEKGEDTAFRERYLEYKEKYRI